MNEKDIISQLIQNPANQSNGNTHPILYWIIIIAILGAIGYFIYWKIL